MIVRRTTDVRCDECPSVCTVEHDHQQDPTMIGFAEPFSRLGWGFGAGGHLCPKCFKKAVEKSRLNPEPLPPLVNGSRILTVPPQPRRSP